MRDPALPSKVAARWLVAKGFFEEGEKILYGKYKNKKGVIVRIFTDEKGHPAIEIEPEPKGRKKNVIMQLYKIWKRPEAVSADVGRPGR